VANESALPEGITTLTDVLRDAGWYTVAFQTNPNAGRPAGLDQGFDVVFEASGLVHQRICGPEEWKGEKTWNATAASGTSELVEFVLRNLLPDWGDLPLFLYVHPMDPHSPYSPREPFASLPGFKRECVPAKVQEDAENYGRDVRTADHFLGRILRQLERARILDRTLVAVVSDHGEEFREHGRNSHGRNLFRETLQIPFLLWAPGPLPEGRILRDRVSALDVLPTVLALLDVPVPGAIEGENLLPRLSDPDPGERFSEELLFAHTLTMRIRYDEVAMSDPEVVGHIAVFRGPWKCVIVEYGKHKKSRAHLYDLRTDPGEANDVAADHPELVLEMRRAALEWWNEERIGNRAEKREVDPEFAEQLRALGYVQ
jgi:arylsulfatase A-like enzyme